MSANHPGNMRKPEPNEIKGITSNRTRIFLASLILISVVCVIFLWSHYLHCDPNSPRIVQFDCIFSRLQKTPKLEIAGVRQLTDDVYYYQSPVWSPDSSTIAVMRNRENQPPGGPDPNAWEIVLIDSETGKISEIIDPNGQDRVKLYPSWSAETGQLLYITQVPSPTEDLPWLAKNVLSLYSPEDSTIRQFDCPTCEWPAWLSKSTVLVNANLSKNENERPDFGLAIFDITTERLTELIKTDLIGPFAVAPDGTEILLIDDQCSGIWNYTIGAEGITSFIDSSELYECDPNWSWNGQKIVYTEKDPPLGAPTYLMISNADGSNPLRILEPELANYQIRYPAWSPDGTSIVFTYGSEGASTVYIMDLPEHLWP
jgi:Tol biopolymer transport system component